MGQEKKKAECEYKEKKEIWSERWKTNSVAGWTLEGEADVALEAGVWKANMTNNLRSLPYSPVTTVFVTRQPATRG